MPANTAVAQETAEGRLFRMMTAFKLLPRFIFPEDPAQSRYQTSGPLFTQLGYTAEDSRHGTARPQKGHHIFISGHSNDAPTLGGHRLGLQFNTNSLAFAYTIGGRSGYNPFNPEILEKDREAGIAGKTVSVIDVAGSLHTDIGLFALEKFIPERVRFYGRDVPASPENVMKLAKIWLECKTGPKLLPRDLELLEEDIPVSTVNGLMDRFGFSQTVNLSLENRAAIADLLRKEDTPSHSEDSEPLLAEPLQVPVVQ